MFSFRTTPLAEQPDVVLHRGKIGVLCNQVAWSPEKGEYLFETLHRRGNLKKVFLPKSGLFGEIEGAEVGTHLADYAAMGLDGVEFVPLYGDDEESLNVQAQELSEIDALIVDMQDVGVRYYSFLTTLFNVFQALHYNEINISVYILDRENPTGRLVEGTMLPPELASAVGIEGLPHRHGLTIGELANLFYSDIGAKFPLHIISFMVRSATKYMMPWSIPPSPMIPGLFTCSYLSGQMLWEGSNVSNGIGTSRPFELFGAPFMESLPNYIVKKGIENWNDPNSPVYDTGAFMRFTRFIPSIGKYAGEACYGFQLLPKPGVQYHSLAHQLRIMRFVTENSTEIAFNDDFELYVGDYTLADYIKNGGEWSDIKEHIKVEEQKWIRKAKRYTLYEDQLWRIKSVI